MCNYDTGAIYSVCLAGLSFFNKWIINRKHLTFRHEQQLYLSSDPSNQAEIYKLIACVYAQQIRNLPTGNLKCICTSCLRYFRKIGSPSNNFSVVKKLFENVTLQIKKKNLSKVTNKKFPKWCNVIFGYVFFVFCIVYCIGKKKKKKTKKKKNRLHHIGKLLLFNLHVPR